jgi:hypothetical protein
LGFIFFFVLPKKQKFATANGFDILTLTRLCRTVPTQTHPEN